MSRTRSRGPPFPPTIDVLFSFVRPQDKLKALYDEDGDFLFRGLAVTGLETWGEGDSEKAVYLVKLPHEAKHSLFHVYCKDLAAGHAAAAVSDDESEEEAAYAGSDEEDEPEEGEDAVTSQPAMAAAPVAPVAQQAAAAAAAAPPAPKLTWEDISIADGDFPLYEPVLQFPQGEESLELFTPVEYFLQFFPVKFMVNVVIPATNVTGSSLPEGSWTKGLSLTEFFNWIGVWLYITAFDFSERRDFWSTDPVDLEHPLPRLNGIMSCTRFEAIISALTLNNAPPNPNDRFHSVRPLIAAWNEHTTNHFRPGSFLCIDESMAPWTVRRTCPGWMINPKKPTPKGNEYHTMADCATSIMLFMELVEGRHHPKNKPVEFEEHGATPGLVMRACKATQISGSKRHIVLDSGFAVVDALTSLTKLKLYGTICIKKKRYWPKGIPGDDIVSDFAAKPMFLCQAVSLTGKDASPFRVFAMREPTHTTTLMSTRATSAATTKEGVRKQEKGDDGKKLPKVLYHRFKLPEVLATYFKCRHAVDDNNHTRQATCDIERRWRTKDWTHRQFAFVLGVSAANAYRAHQYFSNQKMTYTQFRIALGAALMKYDMGDRRKRPAESTEVK